MKYQQEFLASGLKEALPLIEDNLKVVDGSGGLDTELLSELEYGGNLVCFTVRDSGRLVGYTCFMLSKDLMDKGSLVATSAAINLSKEHRNYKTFSEILDFSENCLREGGFTKVVFHIPQHLEKLFVRKGYSEAETVMTKRLGD